MIGLALSQIHLNILKKTKFISDLTEANKSGVTGVSQLPNGKWEAHITYNNKKIYLGRFNEKVHAVEARFLAEQNFIYNFNAYRYQVQSSAAIFLKAIIEDNEKIEKLDLIPAPCLHGFPKFIPSTDIIPHSDDPLLSFFITMIPILKSTEYECSEHKGIKFQNSPKQGWNVYSIKDNTTITHKLKSKQNALIIRFKAEIDSNEPYYLNHSFTAVTLKYLLKQKLIDFY